MNHDAAQFYAAWSTRMNQAKTRHPDLGKAFGPFFQTLMKDSSAEGGLSAKTKELIAVGIAVATHCDACIYTHVEKCIKLGLSSKEIMDAAGVAVVMAGGPAYTYTTVVAAALEHLEHATPAS